MEFVPAVNQIFALLTVAGQAMVVAMIALLILKQNDVLSFIAKRAVLFSFVIVLAATLGSLFYSEIAGYEPCKLCWLQRIFIFPQVILLGMALWKKDRGIADYSIALSLGGAIIAGYQYLLQLGLVPSLPCSAIGDSVSCTQRFVMQFGYITIPLMAFTALSAVCMLMILQKKFIKR